VVFTLGQSDLPPNGFADVPNCANQSSPGFYRIGRVWSSVDPNGNIYVAWVDNRYGVFVNDTSKDYWHVFCSKSTSSSQGDTWSAPIRVSGPTNGTLDQIRASASIGGFGNPFGNFNWVPPGDFLTCDADAIYLYVAWPDSRDNQPANEGNNAPTKVYFRRIQF